MARRKEREALKASAQPEETSEEPEEISEEEPPVEDTEMAAVVLGE